MKDIHSYYNETNGLLNNWESIDLSDEIASEEYDLYTVIDRDNLMSISYRFYNNTSDWWILYLFNKMYDTTFDILNDYILEETSSYYIDLIKVYNTLAIKEQNECISIVRDYYNINNSYKDSILLTNTILNSTIDRNDETFLLNIKEYINQTIIKDSVMYNKIKIPSLEVVLSIKNKMEKYSLEWSQNGN